MRCFMALELPPSLEDEVAYVARQLSACIDGRFMPRDTYHMTLAFLGELDGADASRAADAMERACEGRAPVMLQPDGIGKFGKAQDATLWMGFVQTPELMSLADGIREQLTAKGIDFDDKPFRPHVTLARRARIPNRQLPELAFPEPEEASCVTLFKSTLTREGAIYKPLHEIALE